jgi:S1-C subfamily serine protease
MKIVLEFRHSMSYNVGGSGAGTGPGLLKVFLGGQGQRAGVPVSEGAGRRSTEGEDSMERIVIKHLNGARANQEESFALNNLSALTFGRDPACNVLFDPNLDVVSRNHARIEPDSADAGKFSLIDNRSTNGVFVNGAKITGPIGIRHGDVVRLGPEGPEFQFGIDPPPADMLKATRIVEMSPASKATRETAVPATVVAPAVVTAAPATVSAASEAPPRGVGRETVERMLASVETTSRKRLINWVAGVVGVLVLVTGGLVWYQNKQAADAAKKVTLERQLREQEEAQKFDPTRIAAEYGASTVYIEAAWKLVDTRSKQTMHHAKEGKLPVYVALPDGKVEPLLTPYGGGPVVGWDLRGSGFVVQENGFIMTNRHVAANWQTQMGDALPLPGVLKKLDGRGQIVSEPFEDTADNRAVLRNWVPSKSRQRGGNVDPKNLMGESQYLFVTFAKSKTRIPARIVKTSDEHDAALIKIDTPKALKPVRLAPAESSEELKPGEPIVVLGYPLASPPVIVRTASQDPFARMSTEVDVPDNTVSVGAIGRLLRGSQTPAGGSKDDYWSAFGDTYQLTINSTGPGNSGGPAFDAKGRVIGIYSAGGGGISFATPIKYGLDLMDIKQVIK